MFTPTVSTQDLLEYLPNYRLSSAAEEYVQKTLLTEPSREVGVHARNSVSGAFSSLSQGITIQYESHTAELAWLYRWELDPDVLGFRDQPPMVNMRKADKNGVLKTTPYTPDFILFRKEEVVVVEVKTAKKIVKLSEKYPDQWQFDERWHYIPAEKVFHEKGLKHIVCCLSEERSIETNNYKTMLRACNALDRVRPAVAKALVSVLDSVAWMSLSDLKKQVPDSSYSDIYQLIAQQLLFVELKNEILTEPDSCFIAANRDSLRIRLENTWSKTAIPGSVDTLSVPTTKELENALDRLKRVESGDQSRHSRCLRKLVAEGVESGLSPLQALISRRKGNTKNKLPKEVLDFLDRHIRSFYMSSKRPKLHAAWADYRIQCCKEHPDFNPVVIKTYKRHVGTLDSETVALARGGKRAGNAAADITSVLERALIATRPFERASVDHTKLKIRAVVVESDDCVYSKKPWLSALIDEATGYWLSFTLTYRDPSKRSLSMLYRSCAREYGKFPEHVHSDRGSDFRSVYHRGLLAHYGVTVDWSPAGHSRFNALVERLNKQLQDQWISKRAGNTVDYVETRKYSKGYRPEDVAALSLRDLFTEIEKYRQLYNRTVIGTEAISPLLKLNQGLEQFEFSGIPVEINDEFLLVTAYDTDHGSYKISSSGDVVFNCLHFHHPELRRLRPKRAHTELRIDPEDPYRVYCHIDGNWETALNSGHKKFVSKNPIDRLSESLRVAEGRPMRDKAKQHSNDKKAEALAKFDRDYEERKDDRKTTTTLESTFIDNDSNQNTSDIFERLKLKTMKDLESEES